MAKVCAYCRKPLGGREVTRDHIRARISGGPNAAENVRVACRTCNSMKQMAGECVGALACAYAVAETIKGSRRLTKRARKVLRQWKLMHGATPTPAQEVIYD